MLATSSNFHYQQIRLSILRKHCHSHLSKTQEVYKHQFVDQYSEFFSPEFSHSPSRRSRFNSSVIQPGNHLFQVLTRHGITYCLLEQTMLRLV